MVVIDPGPNDAGHQQAVAEAVSGASEVSIALTHKHGDHAAGAALLQSMLGCEIWGPEDSEEVNRVLVSGSRLDTDQGELVTVPTPGHARHHMAFHWPRGAAVFVGDLLLGEGGTTWVGAYPGCVADYLASLDRLRALEVLTLFPAHGPPLRDPDEAITRFAAHRRGRIAAVKGVLEQHQGATVEEIVKRVYGEDLPRGADRAVNASVAALVEYVRAH